MKQVVGFVNERSVGLRVKPRWIPSASSVNLVANGGMGRVMFSLSLITITSQEDVSEAVERVRGAGHSVDEFMACLRQAWRQRYGKSLDDSLQAPTEDGIPDDGIGSV